ncbi:MAG: beta-lactamase family protein [Bacteroidetes bacterium]|nr:beta-lactamase family protein [Bacteroidota bacterium]MCL1968598.1 beta-lactamase family protein [Bacteroidota bacterium]
MFNFFIFLQIIFATYTPVEKPQKPLAQLSTVEINQLFQEVNQNFKSDALKAELNHLCENLNGSVLMAFGNQVLFKKEVGYKRLAKKTPENIIDAETLFDLASISKQFTAAAVLKLNEEKRLSLTDNVTKFLPYFPYKNITIKHLLTHTSGLPEYMDFPEKDFNQQMPLSNTQLENYLERIKPKILFQPGVRFKYINTNYALLALIVETITGLSFEQYVRKEIFTPAGLHLTCFATELNTKINYAKGHLADRSERPFHFQNGVIGDKGVYTNVEELYRWMKSYLIDYKVLPQNIVEQATQPQNKLLKGTPSELYGYGLRIEDGANGYLVYHGGLWRGFQNNMVYRPSDQYIFIALSNFRNKAILGVNTKLLCIIDGA